MSGSGTPKHLWVVGILSLLWNAMGAFDYVMTHTENAEYLAEFTAEQLAFFHGLPTWVVACWAIAVWGSLLGSLLLLLRKRLAAPVFTISFLTMAATAVHNFLIADGYEIMGVFGAVFSAVIFVVALFLMQYSKAMARNGVLT